jgi:hypothetical protein
VDLITECTRVSCTQYFSFNFILLDKIRLLLSETEVNITSTKKAIHACRKFLPFLGEFSGLSPPDVNFFWEIECTSVLDEFRLRDRILDNEVELKTCQTQMNGICEKLNAEFYSISETGKVLQARLAEMKQQLKETRVGILQAKIREMSIMESNYHHHQSMIRSSSSASIIIPVQ